MRIVKKGGVPPCGRRADRRKVTIAAVAALFVWFTASARAADVDFIVDHDLSSIALSVAVDYSAYGIGTKGTFFPSAPQTPVYPAGVNAQPFPGEVGNVAHYNGHVFLDFQPGTVQILPSTSVLADITGLYSPGPGVPGPNDDPVLQTPPQLGSYGISIANGLTDARVVNFNLQGSPFNAAMAINLAGNFNLATGGGGPYAAFGQVLDEHGRQIFYALGGGGNDNSDLGTANSGIPFPMPLATNAGGATGNYNSVTQTLTIPVNSFLQFPVGAAVARYTWTGVIIAHPFVPEPSTMTLLGFGVVGLLSYAWRARKRRQLVA